jgi:hypothetical protein
MFFLYITGDVTNSCIAILACYPRSEVFEHCRIFGGFFGYVYTVITPYTLVERHRATRFYLRALADQPSSGA